LQRLGRLNRFLECLLYGLAFVYDPENIRPYASEEWHGVEDFLQHIQDRPISQDDLLAAFRQFAPRIEDRKRRASLLDAGPWAKAHAVSLRDISDYRVNAVLESDVPRWHQLRQAKQPTDGLMVPVPWTKKTRDKIVWKDGDLYVASDDFYTTQHGFRS